MQEGIGGCRAQKEPGHGGLSTHETFILWLKFNSLNHFFLMARSTRHLCRKVTAGLGGGGGGGGGDVPCIPHPWIRPWLQVAKDRSLNYLC